MVGVKVIKFHSIEPSAKFEGKWILQATVNSDPFPTTFWLSTKQMGCVQKHVKKPGMVWAAIDYTKPDKPRFVWASDNQEWLTKAFVKEAPETDDIPF